MRTWYASAGSQVITTGRSGRRVKSTGDRLEALKGGRKGQRSIRIDEPWRICFLWRRGDAYEVEIVDYH